jgi:hypothetical protein
MLHKTNDDKMFHYHYYFSITVLVSIMMWIVCSQIVKSTTVLE